MNEPILKVTTAGETYFATKVEKRSNGTTHVFRCGTLGYVQSHSEIRSIEEISTADYLGLFEVGTVVVVPKYGDTYRGRVEEIGRTRVVVRFITRGGKTKRFAFPVRDVGITR